MGTTKRSKKETVILLLVGAMIGLMLTGTAWASSYLTRTQANKLFLGNTKTVIGAEQMVPPSTSSESTLGCPTGYQLVSGGLEFGNVGDLHVVSSTPLVGGQHPMGMAAGTYGKASGWYVRAANHETSTWTSYKIAVICSK